MIVLYTLIAVYLLYGLILILQLMLSKPVLGNQRSQTEEIIVSHNTTNSFDNSSSRPTYKKRNLTIEIPNLNLEIEDKDTQFIKNYFKVIDKKIQCFPLLLFTNNSNKIPKHCRLTTWFTVFSCEIFINSMVSEKETMMISAMVACMLSSPLGIVLIVIFSSLVRSGNKWRAKMIFGYFACLASMVALVYFSAFVEVNDLESFATGCIIIAFLEVLVLEPFRTLIKVIGFLICKDLGALSKFCEDL